MSFDTITKFENIRVHMVEQKALLFLFVDAFAVETDEKTIIQNICTRKDTFLNAASLIEELSIQICEEMDSAIEAACKEERVC